MIKILSFAIILIFLAACSQHSFTGNETNKSGNTYSREDMKKTIQLGEKFTLQKEETANVKGAIAITFLGTFHKYSSNTGVCVIQLSDSVKSEKLYINYESPKNKAQIEWNSYMISLEDTAYDENATFIITKLEK